MDIYFCFDCKKYFFAEYKTDTSLLICPYSGNPLHHLEYVKTNDFELTAAYIKRLEGLLAVYAHMEPEDLAAEKRSIKRKLKEKRENERGGH